MSLSKGSNRNTAKETHLNGRKFDPFNTNNNERDALYNTNRIALHTMITSLISIKYHFTIQIALHPVHKKMIF